MAQDNGEPAEWNWETMRKIEGFNGINSYIFLWITAINWKQKTIDVVFVDSCSVSESGRSPLSQQQDSMEIARAFEMDRCC